MTCVEVGLGEIGSRTIPAEVKAEQSVVRVKPARKWAWFLRFADEGVGDVGLVHYHSAIPFGRM